MALAETDDQLAEVDARASRGALDHRQAAVGASLIVLFPIVHAECTAPRRIQQGRRPVDSHVRASAMQLVSGGMGAK